ncbi:glycoside hydrolase family 19 protein [Xanthovirga aplysinae]|uniref:glycoside hydrolase family 19 protein n=1 Tax=Xanthovirga aplysinae TaxID=2529853 RepID=UPI0012BBDBD1|nr:glycoside hydrolase family 19 protein [Xanthovirga aplysinae]MTI31077.1 LysM peptidoglycan-binding domain-containing protein [Xanthovirga aplysinae]
MKYTIRTGDTLGKISKRFYGDANRYVEIAAANGIKNPDKISVGTLLTIPLLPFKGITTLQLQQIMPNAFTIDIQKYEQPLNELMPQYEINSPLRVAHFIAQLAHESGNFKFTSENLNYSATALYKVFRKYFPTKETAERYARKPELIANLVYANRLGNGDEKSGEGWKYRGRGLIQITGKANYRDCGKGLELDLLNKPEILAETPQTAISSACWFWKTRNINKYADKDDLKKVTRTINGGYHGLKEREEFLQRAKDVMVI